MIEENESPSRATAVKPQNAIGRWREPVAEEGRGAQAPERLKGRKNGPGEVATLEAQWGDVEQCDGVLNQGPAC